MSSPDSPNPARSPQGEDGDHRPGVDEDAPETREEIEAHIEQTRRELGDSVEALGAKLDVKSRAKQRAATVGAQAKDAVTGERGRVDRRKVSVTAAGVGLVAGVGIGLLVWRRSR